MQSNTVLLALKEPLISHTRKKKKKSWFWHPNQVILAVRLRIWGLFWKKKPIKPAHLSFWSSNIYMFRKIKISMHNTFPLQIKVWKNAAEWFSAEKWLGITGCFPLEKEQAIWNLCILFLHIDPDPEADVAKNSMQRDDCMRVCSAEGFSLHISRLENSVQLLNKRGKTE